MTIKLSPDTEKRRSERIIFLYIDFILVKTKPYYQYLMNLNDICIYSNPVGCYDISRNEPRRESLEILMLQTLANMPLVFVIFLYFDITFFTFF